MQVRFTILLCLLSAAAVADNLNIKPGLWEITSTSETRGAPPIPAADKAEMEKQMARMPPEQRAKMEAAIKSAQANLARPVVKKGCITKDDLSKPLPFDGGKGDGTCKRTIVKATSTTQEIRLECSERTMKSNGTLRIVAATPDAWNGTLDGTMSDTGGATELKIRMSGKWLGAACGDVKPWIQK